MLVQRTPSPHLNREAFEVTRLFACCESALHGISCWQEVEEVLRANETMEYGRT